MVPSIGVFVATNYKPTLWRALDSIKAQGLVENDRILVMGDGKWSDWEGVEDQHWEERVNAYGPQFKWMDGPLTRHWGKEQQNLMLDALEGTTDYVCYQEDDDVFTYGIFDKIRTMGSNVFRTMTLYKVLQHDGKTYPSGTTLRSVFDGHCVVCPNHPGRVGRFDIVYSGDQRWVTSCIDAWRGDNVAMVDEYITVCRPEKHKTLPDGVQLCPPPSA